MDHDNTIPSQLGPVHTIPAALVASALSSPSDNQNPGLGGLLFKLSLLAATVGLALYFAG